MSQFIICKFEKNTFANLIKESFNLNFNEIIQKKQFDYLYSYLVKLDTKIIVLEREYMDKDFLEDYTRYYVKSFNNKGYMSARLHFFSEEIDYDLFKKIVLKNIFDRTKNSIKFGYLGFTVIKPLSKTFIGKTCLKIQDHATDVSKKCIFRQYCVDLFGLQLKVDSIAFQEQDKVVSACSTTAIWTALHATSWRSLDDIPACSEITTNAINHISNSTNFFPKKELTNKQIMRALDFEKLKNHPYELECMELEEFISIVKIHIDSNIPLILGLDVSVLANGKIKSLGGHAVTILGYENLHHDKINIYLHDDRVGPFVKVAIFKNDSNPNIGLDKNSCVLPNWYLMVEDTNTNSPSNPIELLMPNSLIVPTHKKVRLSPVYVNNTCLMVTRVARANLRSNEEDFSSNKPIRYNIKLEEISNLKRIISSFKVKVSNDKRENKLYLSRHSSDNLKLNFLSKNYAKYHWVSYFESGEKLAFCILFDATQIPQENPIVGFYVFDQDLSYGILKNFFDIVHNDDLYYGFINSKDTSESFFTYIFEFIKSKKFTYSDFLDDSYGDLRGPMYIKSNEINSYNNFRPNETKKIFYKPSGLVFTDEFYKLTNGDIQHLLWLISEDGALVIGEEVNNLGHPTLTGFGLARIAGEIFYISTTKKFYINSKSGRYSADYAPAKKKIYLINALNLFKAFFVFKNSEAIEIKL